MNFEYNEYLNKLLIIPAILIVLSLVVLVRFFLRLKKRFKIKTLEIIVTAIVILLMMFVGIKQLNIRIISDNVNNTEEISGYIEEIVDVSTPPKFYYLGERVRPKIIRIDGKDYYIMTIGYFEIGDAVTIVYLPNSKIVTSISSGSNN